MPAIPEWLAVAEEDRAVAQLAADASRWNAACFHAQHAAEKYLKAVFERQHLTVPRSHDLEYLCEQLQGTGLPVADIAEPRKS